MPTTLLRGSLTPLPPRRPPRMGVAVTEAARVRMERMLNFMVKAVWCVVGKVG